MRPTWPSTARSWTATRSSPSGVWRVRWTRGCRRARTPCGARRGRASRTACRARHSCRSTRESRGPSRRSWRTPRWSRSGVLGGVHTSSRRPISPCSRSAGCRPMRRIRRSRRVSPIELEAFLAGRRLGYGEAGHGMGIPPNRLRYAAVDRPGRDALGRRPPADDLDGAGTGRATRPRRALSSLVATSTSSGPRRRQRSRSGRGSGRTGMPHSRRSRTSSCRSAPRSATPGSSRATSRRS